MNKIIKVITSKKFLIISNICTISLVLLFINRPVIEIISSKKSSDITPSVKKNIPIFEIVNYDSLPGFRYDNMLGAIKSAKNSCKSHYKNPKRKIGNAYISMHSKDMLVACDELDKVSTEQLFRGWLINNFTPFKVSNSNKEPGLFTGYFIADIEARRIKDEKFKYPIYGYPNDMLTVRLRDFDNSLGSKILSGRVVDNKILPYHDREYINGKGINAKPLLWAKDPIDVFLLHVQGSGIATLEDGEKIKIGYAGNNGYSYSSIGKELIKRGIFTFEEANWFNIREWIKSNPVNASDIINVNRRYIFFREISEKNDIVGALGVPLTSNRSLAVDASIIPLGLPLWIDVEGIKGDDRYQRIMQSQDTGNAIKGIVRGDYFWGYGAEALKKAGAMKSSGDYYILLPKGVVPNI